MAWKIFDAVNNVGTSNIIDWIQKEKITKNDVARLNQKIDMLERNGTEFHPKLVAGPIKSERKPKSPRHIYKLRIRGDRELRPLFCKGPLDMDDEFTLLLGAIEVGDVLDTDALDAEAVRQAVIKHPNRWRKPHERYS